jgi:hypothetical protein
MFISFRPRFEERLVGRAWCGFGRLAHLGGDLGESRRVKDLTSIYSLAIDSQCQRTADATISPAVSLRPCFLFCRWISALMSLLRAGEKVTVIRTVLKLYNVCV